MKTHQKIALGLLAGAGAAWAGRAWLRARRRIDLTDRVVIVTGASTGFGFLIAQEAARRGARLVIAARDDQALQAAAEELRRLGGVGVLAVPTDVTDPSQVEALAARALERFGRIDVLVNNAGIMTLGPLGAMTLGDFEAAMATNFWGALHATRAVLPAMKAQRFGRIANVVSIGGRLAVPHMLPYTASKFALTGLTQGLRAELPRFNILVTGVYPSTIRTGGHTHAWVKGDRDAEYLWFALTDILPILSASAESAARALWRGVCDGMPEVVVGWPTRLAILTESLFPNWSAEAKALVEPLLPEPINLDAPAVQGEDLRGPIIDRLNRQIPDAARPG